MNEEKRSERRSGWILFGSGVVTMMGGTVVGFAGLAVEKLRQAEAASYAAFANAQEVSLELDPVSTGLLATGVGIGVAGYVIAKAGMNTLDRAHPQPISVESP